eukprot:TRINITY_DN71996_c0_g1_i1.p1 TRINITY_DN71996_c0_g1~~TRINITY_DN71996_c0_g1_i1.p1  ORF type:complete len:303 (-),score=83.15 TRINITY_DN71996_c0_g1_i1:303-1142(-)
MGEGGYATGYATAKFPASEKKKKPKSDDRRPLFLYFADVTEADLAQVAAAESKADARKLLRKFMKIDQPEGLQAEILIDMHYHNYDFCISSDFPAEKTSTFLSIMKIVVEDAVRLRLPASDAFKLFEDLLMKHSVERPPFSVGIFSFDDVKSLVEYATHTFFRHYKLYMHSFMTHCNARVCIDEPRPGAAPLVNAPVPMSAADEVDPRMQPELAHLFRPSEAEEAEAEMRRLQAESEEPQDAKTAFIKKLVEEGTQKLVAAFEEKLQQQDQQFQSLLEG